MSTSPSVTVHGTTALVGPVHERSVGPVRSPFFTPARANTT